MISCPSNQIPVIVAGALGRMGTEVVRAIYASDDCQLVGAIDTNPDKAGEDIGTAIGIGPIDIPISPELEPNLCSASQLTKANSGLKNPVLVDFTHPSVVYEHVRASIAYGVNPVIGTTGLTPSQLDELNRFALKASVGSAVIPNFSIGMVLLQQAAAAAASFYKNVELIELHHNKKADSPSGTCIKTAELIEEVSSSFNTDLLEEESFLSGCRGGIRPSGLNIHSIRLPGLVAHQEVMFGAPGETYVLSHNTIDRSAYMPGVLLAVRKVGKLNGLIYGLEKLL